MTAEDNILLAIVSLTVMLGIIFLLSKFSKKTDKPNGVPVPNSFWIFFIGSLYLIFAMQYFEIRPNTDVAIVFDTIVSVIIILMFSVTFWLFRQVKVFIGDIKYSLFRFIFVVFWFYIGYTIVSKGLTFTFNGIFSFQSISLNPEFERLIIPTVSGIVIASYRLTKIFPSKVSNIFSQISEDLVLFSISMSWLSSVATNVQLEIVTDFSFQNMETATIWGIVIGTLSLCIEGFLLWVWKDISRFRPHLTFEKVIKTYSFPFKPRNQRRLTEFLEKKKKVKKSGGIQKSFELLDKKFSIHYQGKTFKPSWFVKSCLCVSGILFIIGASLIPQNTTILVPVYSFELERVSGDTLPFDVTIITSEEMENLIVEKTYAIPIVTIHHQNGTYETPLHDGLLYLNSSQFTVIETGDFIVFNFKTVFAETTVETSVYTNIGYNQSTNNSFDYLGFFRDAEILYSLNSFGYENVTTLSHASMQGLMLVSQKFYIANKTDGETIAIQIIRQSETMSISDSIYLRTLDEGLINQVSFLIKQIDIHVKCVPQVRSPTFPFEIVSD